MSVDDLIRGRLEALVEPIDDPSAIVAAVEGRRRPQGRRPWRMLAAAAAAVLVVAVSGAIWLGGEPDREVVAGPDTTTTASTEPASARPDVSARADQLGPIDVAASPLSPWATGFARHELTFTNTGDTPVHVQDLRSGSLVSEVDGGAPGLLVATDGCGHGGAEGTPVAPSCHRDYRPLGEIAPGESVQVPLMLWTDLPGMVPLTDGTYIFKLAVEHRTEPFTQPTQTGTAGTVEVIYRSLTTLVAEQDTAPVGGASELLRARLALPEYSVQAGSSLTGEVVVQNDTGEPIQVERCGGPYAVALYGESYRQSTLILECSQVETIPVGESRWPVTVRGTYSECVDEGDTGDGPPCGPGSSLPPLPPGDYTASVEAGSGAPVPPPLSFTVTP